MRALRLNHPQKQALSHGFFPLKIASSAFKSCLGWAFAFVADDHEGVESPQ